MSGLNIIQIIGNLGNDPEMKFLPSGKPVTDLRVAVSRVFSSNGGEPQKETTWFDVVCFDKLAEQCNQFLQKGKKAYVQGRLRIRTYEKDGARHYRTEIIADKVIFLDKPSDKNVAETPAEAPNSNADETLGLS